MEIGEFNAFGRQGPMIKRLNKTNVGDLEAQNKRYKCWDDKAKNVKTYAVYYRHNGRDCEYTIGKHGKLTPDQARETAKKKLGKVADGVDVQAEKKAKAAKSKSKKLETLGGFIKNKYKDWVITNRKTGHEIITSLSRDFEHLFTRNMSDITAWDIQKWSTEKLKQGLKPATINRRVVTLKAVLSKAVEWDVISKHPLTKVKPLKVDQKSRVRFLSDAEETRLLNALDSREQRIRQQRINANGWRELRGYEPHKDLSKVTFADYLKPMVLLALNTGMRRGEIFDLTWKNVDLKNRTITIEGFAAKSGSTRHVPLNKTSLGMLIAWANQTSSEGLVFKSPVTKRRFTTIKKAWKELCKEAKIADFRLHDCRHHFASKLVMSGIDLNTVRELLGHSELAMTLRYSHLAPQHKLQAVECLDIA